MAMLLDARYDNHDVAVFLPADANGYVTFIVLPHTHPEGQLCWGMTPGKAGRADINHITVDVEEMQKND